MKDFTKLNKGDNPFKFKLPVSAEYKKLQDLKPGERYHLWGVFISKSKDSDYDDHPVIVADDFYIDLPTYNIPQAEQILNDPELIEAINQGEAGIEIESYVKKKGKGAGKTFNSVKFINWN